ncbi:MAG: hypothetical protein FJ108_06415, partial [Deltaproteobacteria bacterium]|nr:hypothetical protein [Deltaproteobacteria bacterium]
MAGEGRIDADELRARLARTAPESLAAFLSRLAEEDEALRDRIETLALGADPAALAAALDHRLKRFRSGRSFITYGESGAFARELQGWLDDVETQLLATDAEAAWKLVDRFIRADERILGRADDSNGSIGGAFRRACGLWHRAAAALPAEPAWVERVHELHAGDEYGTRDALLDHAATLLSELELRRLARIYEREAESAPHDRESYRSLAAGAALGQIACALGDAALYERSVTIRSPHPNPLQRQAIAEQYLRFGPVERAVEWLMRADSADRADFSGKRLELLARAYEKLGDRDALLDARRQISEASFSARVFDAYAALLPPESRAAAREAAIARAERSDRIASASAFLLDLGADERAAAKVLRGRAQLADGPYDALLSLAQRFESAGHPLPAIACYRALTDQILSEKRTSAYRHPQWPPQNRPVVAGSKPASRASGTGSVYFESPES